MQRLCLVQNQLDLFFMQIYFHQRAQKKKNDRELIRTFQWMNPKMILTCEQKKNKLL